MEGIRGLAVLLVFFVHFEGIFGGYLAKGTLAASILVFAGTVGHAGVDLFFVLSGYLIYGLLIRKDTPYFTFVRRRVQRIYPAFFAVFCAYIVLSLLIPQQSKIHGTVLQKAVYVAQNLLFLPGIVNIRPIITVAWSLSLEFFFYLVMPLLVWVSHMRSWKPSSRIIFLILLWVAHLLACTWIPILKPRMAEFTTGALLCELIRSGRLRNLLRSWGQGIAAFVFLLGISLLMIERSTAPTGVNLGSPIGIGPGIVAPLSGGCLLLVLFACHVDGWLNRTFTWTPIRWLGNMSYSYYLIHGLALKAVGFAIALSGLRIGGAVISYFVLLPIAFAATWTAATLLFVLVEKPFSIRARKPTPAVKVAAAAAQ